MKEPGKNNFGSGDLEEIIAACRQNEPRAQHSLIRMYFGYVKSICLRYSSNDPDADELVNDSFLKVFRHIGTYDSKQPFKGWIRSITIHTAIDYYRKSLRQPSTESLDQIPEEAVSESILDQISAEEILAMVRQLSPVYRMVFSMYVMDGYTHKEIAEQLGIREGTSKSNLQDARLRLQAMILKHNPTLYAAYEMKKSTPNET